VSGICSARAEEGGVGDVGERVGHVAAAVDLAADRVVVRAFDHRDECEGRQLRIGDDRRRLGDALSELDDEIAEDGGTEPAELTGVDLRFRPCLDDRPVPAVDLGEPPEPCAQHLVAVVVGRQRTERLHERADLFGHVEHERAEEVFLVREVQVEGAVRRLGHLHDVVDACREVALRAEDLDASVEQLADGALTAGAQFPTRRRCADARRRLHLLGRRLGHAGDVTGPDVGVR